MNNKKDLNKINESLKEMVIQYDSKKRKIGSIVESKNITQAGISPEFAYIAKKCIQKYAKALDELAKR